MTSKISTGAEVIKQVKDGNSVAVNAWGMNGTPTHLVRALIAHGAKNLTLFCNNFIPRKPPESLTPPPAGLIDLLPQIKKIVSPYIGGLAYGIEPLKAYYSRVKSGDLEIEHSTHGVFIQRFLAGAMGSGPFYSPIGIGTVMEKGKEKRIIDGKAYLLERPIRPDVGFVRAHVADTMGNLVYRGTARAGNPNVAMASRYTIAEVFEIVETGELDPETIVTPGIFVDCIVKIPEGDPASEPLARERTRNMLKRRLMGLQPGDPLPGSTIS